MYLGNVLADFAPSTATLDYGTAIYGRAVITVILSTAVGCAFGSYWILTLAGAWCALLLRLGEADDSEVSHELVQFVSPMVATAVIGLVVGTAARRSLGGKRSDPTATADAIGLLGQSPRA